MNLLLRCRRCGKGLAQRATVQSIAEQFLSLFATHPFQCQICGHRFLAFRFSSLYRDQRAERREWERIPVRFSTAFSGSHIRGEGTVVNISKGGCKIDTDVKVQVGALLYMQLFLSQGEPPVEVAGSVRSAKDGKLGVKFLRVAREEQRLQHFIQQRAEWLSRLR